MPLSTKLPPPPDHLGFPVPQTDCPPPLFSILHAPVPLPPSPLERPPDPTSHRPLNPHAHVTKTAI